MEITPHLYMRTMTRTFKLLLLSALLTCLAFVQAATAAELIDKIITVVNNDVITLSDLNKMIAPMLASYSQQKGQALTDEERAELVKKALDQLIEKKLIEQKAKELDIKVTDKEIARSIDDVLKRNNITLEQLKDILKKDGSNFEEYQKMLKSEITLSKVIAREVRSKVTITEKDIQDYYGKSASNTSNTNRPGERVRIQQIFFTIPPETTAKQAEKMTRDLEEIRSKIVAGEDFGQMAVKYSQDASAKEGGDMGYFSRGELLPLMENAAFNMQAGDVSAVIRTPVGIHIIKVLEKQNTGEEKAMSKNREEIEDSLYRQQVDTLYQKWMEDIKNKAYIKMYLNS
jgi:peptidyl-prolyl cis-trans isomerase SurA